MALVLIGVGCDQPLGAPTVPDDVAAPTVIGLIAGSEQQDDGRLVTLQDGSTVLLPNDATDISGPAADERLLIVGEGRPAAPDGGAWYAAVPAWSSDCFRIISNGEVRGDRLALSVGFSLPLSATWNETETEFIDYPVVGFCLDADGSVVRSYSGTSE